MKIPTVIKQEHDIEVPEGTFSVTFRQATLADDMRRREMFSERRTERDMARPTVAVTISSNDWALLEATEVWCTLEKCSLQDRKGKLLFKKNMDKSEFLVNWGLLPVTWGRMIHDACMVTNPEWGFGQEAQEESEGENEESEGENDSNSS